MSMEVIIPLDLWEEDGDGAIANWLVSDGSAVTQGSVIVEVMIEKVQYEIEAPVSGTLAITKVEEEIVSKGDVIATIS